MGTKIIIILNGTRWNKESLKTRFLTAFGMTRTIYNNDMVDLTQDDIEGFAQDNKKMI